MLIEDTSIRRKKEFHSRINQINRDKYLDTSHKPNLNVILVVVDLLRYSHLSYHGVKIYRIGKELKPIKQAKELLLFNEELKFKHIKEQVTTRKSNSGSGTITGGRSIVRNTTTIKKDLFIRILAIRDAI